MKTGRYAWRWGDVVPILVLLILLGVLVGACTAKTAATPTVGATASSPEPTGVEGVEGQPTTAVLTSSASRTDAAPWEMVVSDPSLPAVEAIPCETSQDLNAASVIDVDLHDGAPVPPGLPFLKTWRIENTGSCSWPEGTQLVLVAGDALSGPSRVPVSAMAPGRQVDVSVTFTAPARPGRYASYWRLEAPEGQRFGAVVFLEILVDSDAAVLLPATSPAPTAPPTPTAHRTLQPTFTPSPRPSPMPSPTMSPIIAASPTAVAPSPVAGAPDCPEPDVRFRSVVKQAVEAGLDLLCASGPCREESGLVQGFWLDVGGSEVRHQYRSLVIQADGSDTIFVLTGHDEGPYLAGFDSFENTWDSSMSEKPAACAALLPPAGYVLPTRGIGKVWCEHSLWLSIGWPEEPAQPGTLTLQPASNGLLIEARTAGGVTYLVAVDAHAGLATVRELP